jgi:hypothetical protein
MDIFSLQSSLIDRLSVEILGTSSVARIFISLKKVALCIKEMTCNSFVMWGFSIYLVRFADFLTRRRYKKQKLKTCDVCKQRFDTLEGMEKHRRDSHPNVPPREASA